MPRSAVSIYCGKKPHLYFSIIGDANFALVSERGRAASAPKIAPAKSSVGQLPAPLPSPPIVASTTPAPASIAASEFAKAHCRLLWKWAPNVFALCAHMSAYSAKISRVLFGRCPEAVH